MSDNLAFYLKYRPQTLIELVGQEAVKKTLLASFQNNKLSHAYLFVGPRGSGKTSTARILAKMINCESLGKDSDPCNKCSACLSITDGSNMDLIEIDAASNRGIEDIRSLREKIKLAPSTLKKKVYIIDEVHMLTTEAFNALLKTLEEPPNHALFILATTELSKIPQTILSRVQRLDFKLAKPQEVSTVLEKIIKEEKIDIEEQALRLLVKKSEGSFRDGVKFLDQVSSFKGKITASSLEENLKLGQFDNLLDFIKNISEHRTKEALLGISNCLEGGVDIKEFMLSVMSTLREVLFIKNGLGEILVKPQLGDDKYEKLVEFSEGLSTQDLTSILDILQNSLEKLKFASIPSLPLELAVVEICGTQETQKSSERLRNSENQNQVKLGQNARKSDNSDIRQSGNLSNSVESNSTGTFDRPEFSENIEPHSAIDSNSPDIQKIKEKWTFVLETIRSFNFSLEALLRSINIKECNLTTVIVEVPYAFHQRILEASKNRDLLESILSDILGRSIKISISLGSRPQRREDIANVELAADDEIIKAAAEIFSSDQVN